MPMFYAGAIGRTVACVDESAAASLRFLQTDPVLSWRTHKSIITRLTVSQSGNYQFLHTIGNDVYIYVFGDRMGSVTISGLSMTQDCNNKSDTQHGFEHVLTYYKQNRVAKRREPVLVHLGERTVFTGFVVGITGDVVDPATRLMQYGLQMVMLPERD